MAAGNYPAVLFVAGVLARIDGTVLWCLRTRDLFAPALAGAGLHPDRVIFAECGNERTVLLCLEEGLRHAGLAGVVGEVARLPMTTSRRLQLAAEASGVTAFVIRRWRTAQEAQEFGQPTAATTRWQITAAPSSPLPVPASVARAGGLSWSAFAAARARCGRWRRAMRRVVSLFLPTWPTDRLRRQKGREAPALTRR